MAPICEFARGGGGDVGRKFEIEIEVGCTFFSL
jgi:hypothetical protein